MSWEESSSTTITIKWDPVPCTDRNGIITGYRLILRHNGSDEAFQNITTTGDENTFTMTGLEPSTEYEIKVAAVTVGVGPFTDESLIASTLGTCHCTIHTYFTRISIYSLP